MTTIDWSQLWYPGPTREFTRAEIARAGAEGPSPTLIAAVLVNVAMIAFILLQAAPAEQTARVTAAAAAVCVLIFCAAGWLWWRPWRRALMQATLAVVLVLVLLAFALRVVLPDRSDRVWPVSTLAVGAGTAAILLWFLVVWRSQRIESRLAELAERERAAEMARQLLAAQIQPHFLFNTLAALTHWVQTKDDRAAPLLDALTGYLRATLPLFQRRLLPLADEWTAVDRYLQVMQLRLGDRLTFALHRPASLPPVQLPPGALLTLVENAVVHGIEPRLAGGRIEVSARTEGDGVTIDVRDDGPGPPAHAAAGTGLTNLRARLAQAFGALASFELLPAPGGGALARLHLPRTETEIR